ncbi:unnamed protein product [Larinioides sclopetarius]|uniref:Uncharacterized protein n=1 Tax=Larinioides sclopetarius TaxID=280406 RepID=A0AAV2AB20_9ARAC
MNVNISSSSKGENAAEGIRRPFSQRTNFTSFEDGSLVEEEPRHQTHSSQSISFKDEDIAGKEFPGQSDSYRLLFEDEGPKEVESRRYLDGYKHMILKVNMEH